MSGNKRKKRPKNSKRHTCPMCAQQFVAVEAFVRHIDSHDWSEDASRHQSSIKLRIEAIMLGLASTAIWEFVAWSIKNLPHDFVQHVLGALFGLLKPMGAGGPSNVRGRLDKWLQDESKRADAEASIEGNDLGDSTALALSEALGAWMTIKTGILTFDDLVGSLRAVQAENSNKYGPESVQTSVAMTNLAGILRLRRQHDEAESLYLEALRIRRSILGEDAQEVVSSLRNLALLYDDQAIFGESSCQEWVAKASRMYSQALVMAERLNGATSPITYEIASEFAFFLAGRGDRASAREIQDRYGLQISPRF